MKRLHLALLLIATSLVAGTTQAAGGFGATAKIGTLGYGVEGTTGITDKVNLRFGYQGINTSFDYDYETDNGVTANFDSTLKLGNASVLVDWHSFSSAFRFTGGLMSNGFKLEGTAPQGNYQIGDNVYNVELGAKFETKNSVAPYFGVGWGNAVDDKKRWILSADLGVLHTGSFTVDLTASGVPEDDIAREEAKIQDELDKYKFYPVATIGVSYRF